jgi:hypothetical protein
LNDIEVKEPVVVSNGKRPRQEDAPNYNAVRRALQKPNGYVYKIIHAFINTVSASLSVEELSKACGTEQLQMDNYDKWQNSKNKYKILVSAGKGKYTLCPDLIEHIPSIMKSDDWRGDDEDEKKK